MKDAFVRIATRHPLWVFAATALLTLLLTAQIPWIHIDTDPENMLPADQPERVFNDQVETRFDLHDALVVGQVNTGHENGVYNVSSLSALHTLTQSILDINGVIQPDVMSLATVDNITQEGPGTIRFEWMMREPPESEAAAQRIERMVSAIPMYQDTLVSGDGKAAAVYVPIESKDMSYRVAGEIRDVMASLPGSDDYHITGLPVAEDTFGHDMFVQMSISAPLAGLVIFLLMWYFFRSWRLVIAPMIVAVVTVLCTMGLLIGLGFTVHIMSSMIPIFLMPIAVVDSVHIMSEFADRYRRDSQPSKIIAGVIHDLYRPMLYTSITSAAGFASLLLTPIPPVQVFGAFVAFGALLAFLVTILFIPAYIVVMNPAHLARMVPAEGSVAATTDSPLSRGLRALGRHVHPHGKLIITVAVVASVLAVAGIMRIQINDNPTRWFKPSHPIRVADQVLNEHFAGTYDAYYVLDATGQPVSDFRAEATTVLDELPDNSALQPVRDAIAADPGDANTYLSRLIRSLDDAAFEASDPAVAERLDELLLQAEQAQERSQYFHRPDVLRYIAHMKANLEDHPAVGKVNALPDIVKTVNRELRSGEAGDYRIPDSSRGVSQTLLQFQSSHRPQDLWHMVTTDYRSTALWLQLSSGDNQDMTSVIDHLDEYLTANPLPEGMVGQWAGKTFINVVWQQAMVEGMLLSLLAAFAVVLVMMIVLFRSLVFGLIAILPLTLTIGLSYGVIGWVGKDYDMPIAVLSALTLGLSIDFAIHFVARFRALCQQTGDFEEASRLIFEEPARAISRNAIVIALGFTPLLLAPLVPYITVGVFMAAVMAISGLVTLILLPALMGSLRGRFERECTDI